LNLPGRFPFLQQPRDCLCFHFAALSSFRTYFGGNVGDSQEWSVGFGLQQILIRKTNAV
jgi:hypothetical protein